MSPYLGPPSCGGHACSKCNKCCDWYHDKEWKPRNGSICSYYPPDYSVRDRSRSRHRSGSSAFDYGICDCK